jgi:anti-anti-sigma factor
VNISVRKIGNVSIVDLQGPLRIGEGEQKFREQVKDLMASGEKNLAVNLAAVPMLDSTGIGALVRTHKLLKEAGGIFTLFAPTRMVRQTLKMVRLDRVLGLYDDEASALAASLPPAPLRAPSLEN